MSPDSSLLLNVVFALLSDRISDQISLGNPPSDLLQDPHPEIKLYTLAYVALSRSRLVTQSSSTIDLDSYPSLA